MMEATETLPTSCAVCGFTEQDFAKTLRLGCSHCYGVFEGNLMTFLPQMHRGTRHCGKVPRNQEPRALLHRNLAEVEAALKQSSGDHERSDALLEQWQQLTLKLAQTTESKMTS